MNKSPFFAFLSKNTFQYSYFVMTYFPFQEIDRQFVWTYENIHGAPVHPITIKSYLQLPFNTFSAFLSLAKYSAYIPCNKTIMTCLLPHMQ